ncbi:class I SAM-dependent methyltransferase [Sanguibacter sp. YZGR15]|uniref:Class I SAM-dependent methyltransferase n=1 Tax=Sanguibacter suaedae TaxID=2795737 RepID=A0A934I5U7_9MICO|nr:class I SAM-dependent methyltransferase [Sanguibacter suaedae]
MGIDPSATMLSWARAQPGAMDVTWIEGDAARIAPTGDVDLVLATGNAIMHLDDDQLAEALTRIAGALRPGGVVSFESRNPAAREWETWTKDATLARRDTPVGPLVEWVEVAEVAGERVTFESHTVLPGGDPRVRTSVLHFRGAHAFETALLEAGLVDIEVRAGWLGESVTERSRLVVYRACTRLTT